MSVPLRMLLPLLAALLIVATVAACRGDGDDAGDRLILATTTSVQDSGLLQVLADRFAEETGRRIAPVAVGSGQAIAQASRGDADVVLAHSPEAELAMVDAGDGIERTAVMYNDFVILGPPGDPAGISGAATLEAAMIAIAEAGAAFISRGDDSGTHAIERRMWDAAHVWPYDEAWYAESGQGQAATLQIANQRRAYTVSDRGSWLATRRHLEMEVVFEGDERLHNEYHAIVVNPERHPRVDVEGARAFVAFLVRDEVQRLIAEFGVEEYGEPLFRPLAVDAH
jgi:tungstate transport system substrate-binding protein